MPDESTPGESIIKERKNTDSSENRGIRGERQFEFEKGISRLAGESVAERYLKIRRELFGDTLTLSGKRMDQLVSDETPVGFPDRKLVAEELLPSYCRIVDELHECVTVETDLGKKAEMGRRLAVMAYILGVILHQAPDGNGQTNKLVSLSYVREFCPEYSHSYFPIKYDDGFSDDSIYDSSTDLPLVRKYFEKITSTLPTQWSQEDRGVFSKIEEFKKIDKRDNIVGAPEGGWEQRWNESFQMMKALVEKIEGINFSDRVMTMLKEGGRPGSLSTLVRGEIAEALNRRYPGYHFSMSGDIAPHPKSAVVKEFVLTSLLTAPEGVETLREYVLLGAEDVRKRLVKQAWDERMVELYGDTLEQFEVFEMEFGRVLSAETEGVHRRKLEEHMQRKSAFERS